jgi:guanylate kinase
MPTRSKPRDGTYSAHGKSITYEPKGEPLVARSLIPAGLEQPPIIGISGTAAAGKDSFKSELELAMARSRTPIEGVINYKMRGPRGTEVVDVDYKQVRSRREYRRLVASGEIAVPYNHNGIPYGLSRRVFDALKGGITPITILDEDGLVKLQQHLQREGSNYNILSFLLWTTTTDTVNR